MEDCSERGQSTERQVGLRLALEHFRKLGQRAVQMWQYSNDSPIERGAVIVPGLQYPTVFNYLKNSIVNLLHTTWA